MAVKPSSLFDGGITSAPSSSTTTANQTPEWYQTLSYQQMMAAKAVADKPYEAYALPRLAEETDEQIAARAAITTNVGAWQPQYDTAKKGLISLAGANPGTTQGVGYMQQAAGYNPMQAQQPYLNAAMGNIDAGARGTANELGSGQQQYLRPDLARTAMDQGQNYFNQAGMMDSVGAAQPYLGQAAGATQQAMNERALAAANPYLQSAAGSSSAGIDSYTNPYNDAVTRQIAKLGARNLQENLLPAISDQFIAAGQFGGSRMGEFGQRALRDTNESVMAQQVQSLSQGYTQALGASQTDLARQAQLAGTVGSIAGADSSRTMQGAGQYAALGQTAGQLTQGQQQNLISLGQAQTGLGTNQQQMGLSALEQVQQAQAQDRARQLQAAQQQAGIGTQAANATNQYSSQLQNIGAGIAGASNSDAQRQQSALQSLAALAQSKQGLITNDAAAMESVGLSRQALEQKQLDQAYKEHMEQQLYPQVW